MKKVMLLMIVAAGLSVANVNAQTEKGTYLMGGSATFQTQEGVTAFSLSPNLGYFFLNNFAAGAKLTLQTATVKISGQSISTHAYLIGPFARYYFGTQTNGKFFGQASLGISGAKDSDTEIGVGVGAGYAFFLNKSIALEAAAYYDKTGDSNGLFTLGVGFQIHLKR